jgi:N-acetyl sugar amidotransferase
VSIITFDRQFDDLPKEVKFCKNCVVSNQRPRTRLSDDGICAPCEWAFEKDHVVNWEEREQELIELLDRHRSKDGSYDVVVPGSGGKDSTYVAHQLKHKYGMHPLCVMWTPFEQTEIGAVNFREWNHAGFDIITGSPDGKIHRKLSKLAFELKGDAWEPFSYGQKAWAFHIATKFGIELMFYGENGELEYGGSEAYKNKPMESPEEWEVQYFKGTSVEKLAKIAVQQGVLTAEEEKATTMQLYRPPPPEVIQATNVEMHWYSYYKKWVPMENWYYAATDCGFRPNPLGRSEGTYTKYTSLDDRADGFHWYLSYMKFGMGRASRDVQTDIRRHHLTREEGVGLVNRYDAEFPANHFDWFLEYLDIDKSIFWDICDSYRELSNVWDKRKGKWHMDYPAT